MFIGLGRRYRLRVLILGFLLVGWLMFSCCSPFSAWKRDTAGEAGGGESRRTTRWRVGLMMSLAVLFPYREIGHLVGTGQRY
jgi:hypothetical protein